MNLADKSLRDIARIIKADWPNPNYGAVPYLRALSQLDTPDQAYGHDSGKSIVLYFLANSTAWRGEVARAVKAELRGRTR